MNSERYLLDADIVQLLEANEDSIVRYIASLPAESIYLSTVTAEEIITGALGLVNRLRSGNNPSQTAAAHQLFARRLYQIHQFQIFPYSEESEQIFQAFPAKAKRQGPQDCRLAAQAIAHGMIVVTRNRKDFELTGAVLADWNIAV